METAPLVFLVDVDNTLLDNDQFQDALKAHIAKVSGPAARDRYWEIQEHLFHSLGYRDYLGAFQTYRLERPEDVDAIWLSLFVVDFPYATLLYPGALELIAALRKLGRVVALTDGDAVFQPRKLQGAGLIEPLDRHIMICVHKEAEVAEIERRYPAERYVVIDDKIRLLTAFKKVWGNKVMTVFPRQGQFGLDTKVIAANPPADIDVDRIAQLLDGSILNRLRDGNSA
ncbi:HAD family hydrolase [Acidisphaera sp. L21]|uniref:HAD family hydrolase n=1 Tax=Acidisphaera sp. L21 TaxID=1641851 RepID=UPI00131CACCC|nr:HAD family hydrolase [Acidisphaera sp. L21]